jgi:hypothetical protein
MKELIIIKCKAPEATAKEYPPTRYSVTLYGCGNCCRQIFRGMKFCPECGRRIKWERRS